MKRGSVCNSDGAALRFLAEHAHTLKGKSMWAHRAVLELNAKTALARVLPRSSAGEAVLACDASASAYGAFMSGDEEWRMVWDFSQSEIVAELSSTVREVRSFVKALQGLQRAGQVHEGRAVQIWTDSQAAYACCSRMSGKEPVFEEVKQLHLLAWEYGVQLSFVWVPREHEALVAADHLSKWQDKGDWRFARTLARQQVFDVTGLPELDCMASKQAHMCDAYFSAVYDGKCLAVDGWLQDWSVWPKRAGRSGKPRCWVFPPVSQVAAALSKVERDQANAIVVMPRSESAEVSRTLARLPVRRRIELNGPQRVMVTPTRRVPRAARAGGWKNAVTSCMDTVVAFKPQRAARLNQY